MTAHTAGRSTLGWAFGVALSILLLALWGRAVVVDTDTLAESLSPLSDSSRVVEFVADWMRDELVEADVEPEMVEPTVDHFMGSSALGEVVDQFTIEVVHAAASTDPASSSIDMASLLAPAAPEVAAGLNELGYPVTEGAVLATVERLEPLVIRPAGTEALVGPSSPAAARLGTAALLAATGLVVFGAGYVFLSEDRIGAVRSLANRVALGGLSFAIFLRVGSWVLDPERGRAPVPETISSLAGAKWMVPLQMAVLAGVAAGSIYLGRRLFKRGAKSRWPGEQPTPPPEQRRSISESR